MAPLHNKINDFVIRYNLAAKFESRNEISNAKAIKLRDIMAKGTSNTMPNQTQLLGLKQQIKDTIRRNSDRGFIPYAGCNRVCAEMASIITIAESCSKEEDYRQAFDIYRMLILETARLVSHADDSGGGCSDIMNASFNGIDWSCKNVAENESQYFFDTLLKTARNKVFADWPDWAYQLLKAAVCFVNDQARAGKIYDILPTLGKMYNGEDYPDKYLITLGIIERVQGKEAARQYLFEHLELDEFREIAVKNAMADRDFALAERLCREALMKSDRGCNGRTSKFLYFLEQIYEIIDNTTELTAIRRAILLKGDTAYFRKLKSVYERLGVWDREKDPLWSELSRKMPIHYYMALLSQENELELLLDQIKKHKSYIADYGKQLAAQYPDEAYQLFEEYIFDQAGQAKDRRTYRQVCAHFKKLAEAGATLQARTIIARLSQRYPRRTAMLEELARLEQKLNK